MTTTTEKPMSRSYLSLLPPRLHAAPMAEEFAATLADWVGESQNGAPAYQREAIPPRNRWTEVASDVGREQREKATGVAHCYRVLDLAGAVIRRARTTRWPTRWPTSSSASHRSARPRSRTYSVL